MIDISVVIPTYNRKDILLRTLESLIDQTYPKNKYEIIVVDDGSTEDIKGAVDDFVKASGCSPLPEISYLRQDPSKKGPAAANNLGIKAAKGTYILLMNNDVIADRRLIEEHMRYHKETVKACGRTPQPYGRSPQPSTGRTPQPVGRSSQQFPQDIIVQGRVINTSSMDDLGKKHKGYTGGYSDFSFGYFTTWNCSLSKEILIKAGLFDEDFRHLCWEDVELGYRLRKMGIKQKNNPAAFGYHFRHEFFVKDIDWVRNKSLNMGGNAVIYFKKHPCLEVKISTENFWLPMMLHSVAASLVKFIGSDRILKHMKRLEKQGRHRLLGFLVGLAGKYWFWTGVKRARAQK